MKYLKILDRWADRWDFLQAAPPKVFVLASADGEHIMYKGENDQSVTIQGDYTYNFIHCAPNIYEQEAKVYFDQPLPQNINLLITWVVKADNGRTFISKASKYCAKNSTSVTFDAPTTIESGGVQYNVSDIENFIITGHTFDLINSATIITV